MINFSSINVKANVALDAYLSLIELLNDSVNYNVPENLFPIKEGISLNKRLLVEVRKVFYEKELMFNTIYTNVRDEVLNQRWDKEIYQTIAGNSFDSFKDIIKDSNLELIITLHHYLKLFLGRSDQLEYKLALTKLLDHLFSLNFIHSITLGWVSSAIFNTSKSKTDLYKEAQCCYYNILQKKAPIYKIENNRFELSSSEISKDSDFQVFTLHNNAVTKVSKVKDEISCQFYISKLDISKPVNNEILETTQSIDLYYDEGFDESKEYTQNSIDLTRTVDGKFLGLEFWGSEHMINFFIDFKKKSLFPLVDDMLKPILQTNDSSFSTDYKALIASSIFNILRTKYKESEVTDHKIKHMTGYFLVELRLLMPKDAYLDSDKKGSFNKYIRQNIENLLKKRKKSKLLNFKSYAEYNIEKMDKWVKLTPNNPFSLRKIA